MLATFVFLIMPDIFPGHIVCQSDKRSLLEAIKKCDPSISLSNDRGCRDYKTYGLRFFQLRDHWQCKLIIQY